MLIQELKKILQDLNDKFLGFRKPQSKVMYHFI